MTHTISRRKFLEQFGLACGSLPMLLGQRYSALANASPCPEISGETITWIVPNTPGGGYDSYSRLIEPYLEKALNAQIVIRNVPGAGGLIGARSILSAAPDGRTLGIINGAGLLAATLAGEARAPHPVNDFTLLGRVVQNRQVWATGRNSSFNTIADVFNTNKKRSIIFGTRDVGSLGFLNMTLASNLLGLNIDVVAGYQGSSAGVLAAARGEVDLVCYSFDSIVHYAESGDLRPLLQISNERISPHLSLADVPILGSTDGFAAQHAQRNGLDIADTLADVTAMINLVSAGRLIVAPPGMKNELSNCLEKALLQTLHDPEFQEHAHKADLSLDIAASATARAEILSASAKTGKFIPIIQNAIQKVRQ